jgi:hypothetical protein
MRTTLGCLINFIVEISRLICIRPRSFCINKILLPINSTLTKVAKLMGYSKVRHSSKVGAESEGMGHSLRDVKYHQTLRKCSNNSKCVIESDLLDHLVLEELLLI